MPPLQHNRYWQVLGLSPCRDVEAINEGFHGRISIVDPHDQAEDLRRLQEAREYALAVAGGESPILEEAYLIPDPDSPGARAAFRAYDTFRDIYLHRPAEHDRLVPELVEVLEDRLACDAAGRERLLTWLVRLLARHRPKNPALIRDLKRIFRLGDRLPANLDLAEDVRFWFLQAIESLETDTRPTGARLRQSLHRMTPRGPQSWAPQWSMMLAALVGLGLGLLFIKIDPFDLRTKRTLSGYAPDEAAHFRQADADGKLIWAVDRGEAALVRAALAQGADVNSVIPDEAMPVLVLASNQGHVQIASLLLQNGADVTGTDRHGFQALHHAVANNDERMLTLIMAHGADPDDPGQAGLSAMDMARNHRHLHLMELMTELGSPSAMRGNR